MWAVCQHYRVVNGTLRHLGQTCLLCTQPPAWHCGIMGTLVCMDVWVGFLSVHLGFISQGGRRRCETVESCKCFLNEIIIVMSHIQAASKSFLGDLLEEYIPLHESFSSQPHLEIYIINKWQSKRRNVVGSSWKIGKSRNFNMTLRFHI